ncbi:MAG: hypothetical protein JW395_2593 [Nitrospira sp.]|nr:hypothetical protein [Nitrospira sp.]
MAEEKKPIEPLSDEAITGLVNMTLTAETMAVTMGIPVHKAVEFILKTAQLMQKLAEKTGVEINLNNISTKGTH